MQAKSSALEEWFVLINNTIAKKGCRSAWHFSHSDKFPSSSGKLAEVQAHQLQHNCTSSCPSHLQILSIVLLITLRIILCIAWTEINTASNSAYLQLSIVSPDTNMTAWNLKWMIIDAKDHEEHLSCCKHRECKSDSSNSSLTYFFLILTQHCYNRANRSWWMKTQYLFFAFSAGNN